TRSCVLPLVLFGLLAAAPLAHAVITDHSGTICKHMFPNNASSIGYFPDGTRYLGGGSTWVICPLTRDTSDSNGAYIYVDIMHFGVQSTICFAYSHDYTGTQLAFALASWSGSGFHEFAFNLTGAVRSDAWSTYSVACFIPGNGNGVVLDVNLSEW